MVDEHYREIYRESSVLGLLHWYSQGPIVHYMKSLSRIVYTPIGCKPALSRLGRLGIAAVCSSTVTVLQHTCSGGGGNAGILTSIITPMYNVTDALRSSGHLTISLQSCMHGHARVL